MAFVAAQGQQPQAPLPDLVKVKDSLYVIGASSPADRSAYTGGNTGVFVTDTGVVVVDTKLTGSMVRRSSKKSGRSPSASTRTSSRRPRAR